MVSLARYCSPRFVVADNFENNIRPWAFHTLQTEFGGVPGWRVGARRDIDHVSWFFELPKTNPLLKMKVHYYMATVNHEFEEREPKFYGSGYFTPEDRIYAYSMITADIMNPENGWLTEDGALYNEIGLYMESINNGDGIWRFNFYQRNRNIFDKREEIYVPMENGKCLYFSKQLLNFHSPVFAQSCPLGVDGRLSKGYFTHPNISDVDHKNVEKFLQIVHGVQLKLTELEKYEILRIAHRYGFGNVVRYCENQLIQNLNFDNSHEDLKFQWAFTYGLNRFLLHLLKTHNIKLDSFGKVLILWNFREMSAETMKLIVKKFLYEEF